MAFSKVEEVRQLDNQELAEQILELKKKLVNLRLLKATGRMEKHHEFKHTRHRLAQLMTVEHERKQPEQSISDPGVAEDASQEQTASLAKSISDQTEAE
ncbi:MAG: 50S ribosomal protein L29 [Microcoleaceae cyanobacterium]